MIKSAEQWIGAYYPDVEVKDQRSKAILCILFDKIICHFPIADMACGGGSGMSEAFCDNPLVEEGVIEIREEFLLPEIEPKSTPENYWGNDEDFTKFVDLQTTAMALNICDQYGTVPVTDAPNCPIPLSAVKEVNFLRFANLQAAALAVKSLDIAIPPIADITDEDILKAREKLREQLIPFRYAMLSLAPLVREGIKSNTSLEEIFKEATYITETNVAPTVYELQRRLAMEKGQFWKRLIFKGSKIVPKFILNWTTKDALSATIASISDSTSLTSEIVEHRNILNSLKNQGGLGFLLSVAEYPRFKK